MSAKINSDTKHIALVYSLTLAGSIIFLDLVETHSNITSGSEEHSVEVSARHYHSYE